jgi:hypothetical protein
LQVTPLIFIVFRVVGFSFYDCVVISIFLLLLVVFGCGGTDYREVIIALFLGDETHAI